MNISRKFRFGAVLAAGALLLSACGGGGSSSGSDDASGPTEPEVTNIKISLLPIIDVLPVQLAIQQGIFEKHGLKVESVPAQSGAGLVPSVLEGSVDVAYGNPMTYFLGMEKGLPLDVVFMGGAEERPPGTPGGDHSASVLMVNADSPIKSPADLSGKTVSVNAVGNIQEVAVKNAIEKAGGDPSSVQLLELPLSQAQGALDAGRVDAASVNEPFTTVMMNAGKRVIGKTIPEIDGKNATIELYFTSRKFAQAHPKALDKFREAMNEAIDIINNDIGAARTALKGYTEIDPAIIDQLTIYHFEKGVTKDAVSALIDAAEKYGVIDEGDKVSADKVLEQTPTVQDK